MLLKRSLPLFFAAIASVGFAVTAKADTVKARCDVYPKGSDRASWYGLCTFSQQQGFVDIQLQNGKSYDLRPVADQADKYVTQNGQPVTRELGLGDKGQIYRFVNESIFVYWDPAPFDKPASNPTTSSSSTSSSARLGTLSADSPNARINLRSGPTINSSASQYGVPGDQVEILCCEQDKDTAGSDLNWCNVRFVSSKATGWIRSDLIIFSDGGE